MRTKILSLQQLLLHLATHRHARETIVFTNGCFDLLHIGHIRYLEEAKTLGDRLVVGVNSDRSVRLLFKGEGRPIIPDHQRAEVLSGLESVDYVVIFEETDPLNVIKAIQPQVLVKGGDWTPDRIVGKEFVEERGGKVRTIPLIPDSSTTMIIQKILGVYGFRPTAPDSVPPKS